MNKSIFIYTILVVALVGCGKTTGIATDTSNLPAPTPNPGGGSTTTPGAPPVVTAIAPLALQIYTQYDTTGALEYQNFTETGTTICSSTKASPVATCTLPVPEGRLFYSSVNFQLAWNTQSCKILVFQPYFYHASNSDTFSPPWSSGATFPCSTKPLSPGMLWWSRN